MAKFQLLEEEKAYVRTSALISPLQLVRMLVRRGLIIGADTVLSVTWPHLNDTNTGRLASLSSGVSRVASISGDNPHETPDRLPQAWSYETSP